jgi:hypothetical protein
VPVPIGALSASPGEWQPGTTLGSRPLIVRAERKGWRTERLALVWFSTSCATRPWPLAHLVTVSFQPQDIERSVQNQQIVPCATTQGKGAASKPTSTTSGMRDCDWVCLDLRWVAQDDVPSRVAGFREDLLREYVLAAGTADRCHVDSTAPEIHVESPEERDLDVWARHFLPSLRHNLSCVLGGWPHLRKQSCHDPTELVLSRGVLRVVALPFLRYTLH